MARGPQLTRKDMEEVINQGGSVLYQGRHISTLSDLPSEAELAQGDEAAEDRIIAGKQEHIKALQKEIEAVYQKRGERTRAAAQAKPAEPAPAAAPKEPAKEPAPQHAPATKEPVKEPAAPTKAPAESDKPTEDHGIRDARHNKGK